ncbi:MAG TPA: AI-2E family transporter [Candidatus Binatia bacterium]
MNVRITWAWLYGALIVALSAWILQSFLLPLLVACVTAVASWPLYRRLVARLPRRMPSGVTSLIFTAAMTVFVLAPLMFALGALLAEAKALLLEIAAADKTGIAVPHWVENVPLIGSWVAARWQSELAHPGALSLWTEHTDPSALLGWAQSLGQFTGRHLFIIGFTILILFFLYQKGESLAEDFRRVLRDGIGERAEAYIDIATCAVRASVNSMLIVALFDGCATGIVYAIAGVTRAALWGATTGLLAMVPFLGYVAVAALTLQLVIAGAAKPALVSLGLGCVILLCGDKIVRPVVAGEGTHLRFVWFLMASLGGFEVLGLVGLAVGPVVHTLARELWEQRVRDLAPPNDAAAMSPADLKVPGVSAVQADQTVRDLR